MWTIMVWWLVCGYFPASMFAVLAVAALNGPYSYRGRHGAPGRRRARTSTWEQAAGVVLDTPEVRVARVRIDAVAEALVERSRLWNEGPSLAEVATEIALADERRAAAEAYLGIDDVEPVRELERHEGAAGSPAYLDLPTSFVGRARVADRHDRISTAEMTIRFGADLGPVLGPVLDDEFSEPDVEPMSLPDEDGDDPGTGRHTRRRRERVKAGAS